MVAVVPLPAVGLDGEDVAAVALRHEADLVGNEVVGLWHRVTHEGFAAQRLAGVGDEVLVRQVRFHRPDHGLDAVRARPVPVHLE